MLGRLRTASRPFEYGDVFGIVTRFWHSPFVRCRIFRLKLKSGAPAWGTATGGGKTALQTGLRSFKLRPPVWGGEDPWNYSPEYITKARLFIQNPALKLSRYLRDLPLPRAWWTKRISLTVLGGFQSVEPRGQFGGRKLELAGPAAGLTD